MSVSDAIAHVEPQQDRLVIPEEVPPTWSENLVLTVHDPKAGVSLYFHFSRMHGDPRVWEAVMTIYQPNGSLLASRSFGAVGTADSADTGACSFTCEEPLRKWRARFNGMARRCTTRDMAEGLLRDGPVERVRLDLAFEGVTHTWSAGAAMDKQDWGDVHLAQGGRITGTVEIDGRTVTLDCHGMRDHTRGTRDYSSLDHHLWFWAFFPSGRICLAVAAWQDSGEDLVMGFVQQDGEMVEAEAIELPVLADGEGDPYTFDVRLGSAFGEMVMQADVVNHSSYTLAHPIGMPLGIDWSSPRNTIDTEGPVWVRWGDEEAPGFVERGARAGSLRRPS